MVKAVDWLKRAADLDPSDDRIPAVQRSCAFNLQTIDGTFTADVLLGLNGAASQSWFDTFTAMMLLLDELPLKTAVRLAAEIAGASRKTLYARALELREAHDE